MLSVVNDDGTTTNRSYPIDEIARKGARRRLAAALEAEVNAYTAQLASDSDDRVQHLEVRNGCHQPARSRPRPAWSR
ncbi:hypothetical protein RI578_38685 [Streptomyces sp. BB1-1-1]|uniref:hypothetical protein n=1 Tax=Streptomyces sp. BB1-1-1 TaxID=3074430 RepID=UPI0028774B8B|nr:hypothetical protein [Streptomyces sp. BB1-1-1]WND39857.1 hypothetical protein RI578_38685 [Streptomyces sp. BB1-1-1]